MVVRGVHLVALVALAACLSCGDDLTKPTVQPTDEAITRMARDADLVGAIAVAKLGNGRTLVGSSLGSALFEADRSMIWRTVRPLNSLSGEALSVRRTGNDAPLSSLVIVVEPSGGGSPYMRDAMVTDSIRWTFGCVDPVSGAFFPMDHARIDSTVNTAIDQTGGHNNVKHVLTDKPIAVWSPADTTTTTGRVTQRYTADIAAGDEETDFHYVITDPAAPASCKDNPQSISFLTGIRKLGLVELVAGTNHMYFDGITSDHFSVFYVTSTVKAATDSTAKLYFAATGSSDSLRINAASLVFGGINDIPAAWAPPHHTHRLGTDLDLDGKNDHQTTHDDVLDAAHRAGFARCFAELNKKTQKRDHVHCFHEEY